MNEDNKPVIKKALGKDGNIILTIMRMSSDKGTKDKPINTKYDAEDSYFMSLKMSHIGLPLSNLLDETMADGFDVLYNLARNYGVNILFKRCQKIDSKKNRLYTQLAFNVDDVHPEELKNTEEILRNMATTILLMREVKPALSQLEEWFYV